MKKYPSIALYIFWAFLISYSVWGICIAGQLLGWLPIDSNWNMPFLIIGGNGPPIAAYIYFKRANQDFSFKKFINLSLNVKQKPLHYALAILFIALFFTVPALTGGIDSGAAPGMEENFDLTGSIPIYLTVLAIPVFFFFGGSEEVGWRGVLQPELEKKLPFIPTAFVIAVIWVLWHVPLWFMVGSTQSEVNFWLFLIGCTGLSFALTAVRRITGSVFLCVLIHCATNALQGTWPKKDDLLTNLSSTVAFILISVIFVLWDKKSNSKHPL